MLSSRIFWFPLSYREVEDTIAERGVEAAYETIRRWTLKFGQDLFPQAKALRVSA